MDGTILDSPSLLSSFHAVFFADLKKYKFIYHFAFPAIHSDPPWRLDGEQSAVGSRLRLLDSTSLFDAVQTWKYSVDHRQHGFFLAKRRKIEVANAVSTSAGIANMVVSSSSPLGQSSVPSQVNTWTIGPLSDFEAGFFNDTNLEDRFVCFADPSTYPTNPGWMLRNLLVLIRQRWQLNKVQILSYRDTYARRDQAQSIILQLVNDSSPTTAISKPTLPKVTGWERNEQNKLNSKTVDLADYMDPTRLADQSVDLNLKLMKWRIAPGLDLDIVRSTKCLLLGAGTLGSYVARNLLGWGVRYITFVDNATVSFSNPVRQPLFTFDDCLDGGAKKAVRAAAALREIYPGVRSEGHVMSVPMAGHPVLDDAKVKTDYEKLRALIDEHDAVFLLMDTRESRWLPTLMGKAAGKIVMNAALGFDSYVVMRHGAVQDIDTASISTLTTTIKTDGSKQGATASSASLGCYFCNDVVAPADVSLSLHELCRVGSPLIQTARHSTRSAHSSYNNSPSPSSSSNKSSSIISLSISAAAASARRCTSASPLTSSIHPFSPNARLTNPHPSRAYATSITGLHALQQS